ncbi:hypothetical protein [Ignatzschineria sp. LJL83]
MKLQHKIGYGILGILVTVAWLFFVGRDIFSGNVISTSKEIELHFGKQGVKDFKRYNYNADNHPSGVGFISIYFSEKNLGNLRIIGKNAEIEIPNVMRAMGVQYGVFAEDGIMGIDINSRLHEAEFVTQEVAYEAYVALMQEINKKGWKHDLTSGRPRIDVRDNLKHIQEQVGTVIDPTYILTFEEWKDQRTMFFDLWNNDLLLGITINRRPKNNVEEMEQYTLRYAFNTQKYYMMNGITDSHKISEDELREAFEKKRQFLLNARKKGETRYLKEGYRIDESREQSHDLWQYLVE